MKPTNPCFLFVIGCFLGPFSGSVAAEGKPGRIEVALPAEVQLNQPFIAEVSLTPDDPNFAGTVTVSAGKNQKVKCEPDEFQLKPGQRQKVTVTVLSSNTGLGVVYFYANGWDPFDTTVIVGGVTTRLLISLNKPIESRTVENFYVALNDKEGKTVRLDASASLQFQASNLWLYSDQTKEWRPDISAALKIGEAISFPLKLKATSWTPGTGLIRVQLVTPQGLAVYDESVTVQIRPPWYVPLLVAIGGGLFLSLWQFLRRTLASRRKTSSRARWSALAKALLLGLGGGVLAYLLADWNVLGIRTDTTGLRGFFILGLLFSYVGADFILSVTTQTRKSSSRSS